MTKTLDAAIRSAALAGTAALLLAASPGGAASAKDAAPTPIEFYASISVKPEAMDGFLAVMRANARASREEAGNVSFDVYRRADCGNELLLMERWTNAAAHEAHLAQPYNEPLNAIWAESLARPLGEGRRLLSDAAPS